MTTPWSRAFGCGQRIPGAEPAECRATNPARPYAAAVDILILLALLGLAVLILRGARRGLILSLWVVTLIAMLALFRYHVTSPLDLSF